MTLRSPRACRLLAVLLAVSISATGVPWSEVHAHAQRAGTPEHGTATDANGSLEAHLEAHHIDGKSDDQRSESGHLHEYGLFGTCPGVPGFVTELFMQRTAASAFPDPSVLYLSSYHSPLLRPPARV